MRPDPRPGTAFGHGRSGRGNIGLRQGSPDCSGPEPATCPACTGAEGEAASAERGTKIRRKAAAGLEGTGLARRARAPCPKRMARGAKTGAVATASRSRSGGLGSTPSCCKIVAAARGGPGAHPSCCASVAPQSMAVARPSTCNSLATHIRLRHCEALARAVRRPRRRHTIM